MYKDRKAEELQEGGWCLQIPGYVRGPGVSGELCSIQYCMSFARLGVGNRCPEGRSWLNALAIACSETTLVPWACCFATPWTAACQASLSFTIFYSLFKLMSTESVMPSNHLVLCRLLLLACLHPPLFFFWCRRALCREAQRLSRGFAPMCGFLMS